jgi:hypothetical protein
MTRAKGKTEIVKGKAIYIYPPSLEVIENET